MSGYFLQCKLIIHLFISVGGESGKHLEQAAVGKVFSAIGFAGDGAREGAV